MTGPDDDVLESYIQADASLRAGLFKSFIRALGSIFGKPEYDSASWARRAISCDLDYFSLHKLRKFLPPAAGAPIRLAVLGGPTTLQLVEVLKIFLDAEGVAVEFYEGEYGLFRQEILSPDSKLDRFNPQIIFLATSHRDLSRVPKTGMNAAQAAATAKAELADWFKLWETAKTRWGATVIQNTFDVPPWSSLGHFSGRCAGSRENYISRMNCLFEDSAPMHVVLHDLRALINETNGQEWFDPRFYLEAKMPCGPKCLIVYAHSVMTLVRALRGRSKKVLVLDLDNTIWGGVVGDLGPGGLVLGQGSAEGEAYLAFQEYLKSLHARGIVLAVCSKNDEDKAKEPFRTRDDMALKLEHIACFVANWQDKATNLREIASRLDVGLDSLVLVDDNPAERALVRQLAPEVSVPDFPEDPAGYARALARQRYFETVSFTEEDGRRTDYYAQNVLRKELASRSEDISSFLASLNMVARIQPVSDLNIERAVQLINKSNQFNLTTRRYNLEEVRRIAGDPSWSTVTISLKDNHGDSGLISVLLLHQEGPNLDIDTWLMSCRVLQRGVEQFALKHIVGVARDRGCTEVVGRYSPTEKNGMVKELLPRLGFLADGQDGATTRWRFPVSAAWNSPHVHINLEVSR